LLCYHPYKINIAQRMAAWAAKKTFSTNLRSTLCACFLPWWRWRVSASRQRRGLGRDGSCEAGSTNGM